MSVTSYQIQYLLQNKTMKRFSLLVLLFIGCISFSSAQEDTTRMHQQSISKLLNPDSLRFNQNSIQIESMVNNPTNIDENGFDFSKEEKTFNFDIPKEKKFFNSSYSKFIIPTTLIAYGVLTRANKPLRELDLSTNHEVGEHISKKNPLDNYIQFAPAIMTYSLSFAGVKAKHNFRDQTLIMATSYLIMGATVQTVKSTTHIARPNGSNNNSFPSGHTATAFVGAHILFKEYKDTSPWIGIGGYAVATATGTMRVLNKKHWVSDVVTGAGIGILSTELGYMLLPVWHNILGIKEKEKSLVIVPTVNTGNMGIALAYAF
ncbi:phosphatase PAP2 family protein [Dysgonomonas sp. HGC4]|uniref:phosphatase PAP2 family protein n=2 Tax=Dysgonomonas sp. HGC4 TaxID=1658009 RepID=UPI002101BBD4|nr:phosphatase PAP2 family protein [Dysgonomonas sp. HGC4]